MLKLGFLSFLACASCLFAAGTCKAADLHGVNAPKKAEAGKEEWEKVDQERVLCSSSSASRLREQLMLLLRLQEFC